MKTPSLEWLVGLFFMVGIGAVFILTFRVASLSGSSPDSAYSITATFSNIGGLKPGAAVTMAGVRIGRVREISTVHDTYEAAVRMELDAESDNLPIDSVAKILTAGLLGEQYIGIDPGGDDKSLVNGDKIKLTQSALVLEDIVGQFVAGKAMPSAAVGPKAMGNE